MTKKFDMMTKFAVLAGVPITESYEDGALVTLLEQEGGAKEVIVALRDTDYRDQESFFKMVQLLKGLATSSEKDEMAKKYLSAVSDALTTAAKDVLGEKKDEACATPGEKKRSDGKGLGEARKSKTLDANELNKEFDKGANEYIGVSLAVVAKQYGIGVKEMHKKWPGKEAWDHFSNLMASWDDLLERAKKDKLLEDEE